MGYNSDFTEDTAPIPAPFRGLSRLTTLSVQLIFLPDQRLLPCQRNIENYNRKFAIIRLITIFVPYYCIRLGVCLLTVGYFRYHGNGGLSDTNFNSTDKLVDTDNPIIGAGMGVVCSVQGELQPILCSNNSGWLPCQQGSFMGKVE